MGKKNNLQDKPAYYIDPKDPNNYRGLYQPGTTSYEAPSQYDQGLLPGYEAEEFRAYRQPWTDKLGNGLVNMTSSAFTGALESTVGVVYGAGAALFSLDASKFYDNEFGRSLDAFNNYARETNPFYYSEAEKNASLLGGMGYQNFWFDKVLGGAGYTVGSLLAGYGMGKAFQMGKTARLAQISDELGQAAKAGAELSSEALKYARWDMGKQIALGGIMAHGESSMEARQTYDSMVENLTKLRTQALDPNTEPEIKLQLAQYANLTDDKIDNLARSAADTNYLVNMAVTGPTDMLLLGKFINPGKRAAMRTYNEIGKKTTIEGATQYFDKAVLKKGRAMLNGTESFLKGFATEGTQEGAQFASNIAAQEYVEMHGIQGNDWWTSITEGVAEGLTETLTSKEGLESILVGGIVGGPFGLKGARTERLAQDARTKQLVDTLNADPEFTKSNPKVNAFLASINAANKSEDFLRNNDLFNAKNKADQALNHYIKSQIDLGTADYFVQKLQSIKEMEQEERDKYFGPGTTPEQIDQVINKVAELSELNNSIETLYGTPGGTPEQKAYNELLRKNLFFAASTIKDVEGRVASIEKDLKDLDSPEVQGILALRELVKTTAKGVKVTEMSDEGKALVKTELANLANRIERQKEAGVPFEDTERSMSLLQADPEKYFKRKLTEVAERYPASRLPGSLAMKDLEKAQKDLDAIIMKKSFLQEPTIPEGMSEKEYAMQMRDQAIDNYNSAVDDYVKNNPVEGNKAAEMLADLNELDNRRYSFVEYYNELNDPDLAAKRVKELQMVEEANKREVTDVKEEEKEIEQLNKLSLGVFDKVITPNLKRETSVKVGDKDIDLAKLSNDELEELRSEVQVDVNDLRIDGLTKEADDLSQALDKIKNEIAFRQNTQDLINKAKDALTKATTPEQIDAIINTLRQSGYFDINDSEIQALKETVAKKAVVNNTIQQKLQAKINPLFRGVDEFYMSFTDGNSKMMTDFEEAISRKDAEKRIYLKLKPNTDSAGNSLAGKLLRIGKGDNTNNNLMKISPPFVVEVWSQGSATEADMHIGYMPWPGQFADINGVPLNIQDLTGTGDNAANEQMFNALFEPDHSQGLRSYNDFKNAHSKMEQMYKQIEAIYNNPVNKDKAEIVLSVDKTAQLANVSITKGNYNVETSENPLVNFKQDDTTTPPLVIDGTPVIISTSSFDGTSNVFYSKRSNNTEKPNAITTQTKLSSVTNDKGNPVLFDPTTISGGIRPEFIPALEKLRDILTGPKIGNTIYNKYWMLVKDPQGSITIDGLEGTYDWRPLTSRQLNNDERNAIFSEVEELRKMLNTMDPTSPEQKAKKDGLVKRLNKMFFMAIQSNDVQKNFKNISIGFTGNPEEGLGLKVEFQTFETQLVDQLTLESGETQKVFSSQGEIFMNIPPNIQSFEDLIVWFNEQTQSSQQVRWKIFNQDKRVRQQYYPLATKIAPLTLSNLRMNFESIEKSETIRGIAAINPSNVYESFATNVSRVNPRVGRRLKLEPTAKAVTSVPNPAPPATTTATTPTVTQTITPTVAPPAQPQIISLAPGLTSGEGEVATTAQKPSLDKVLELVNKYSLIRKITIPGTGGTETWTVIEVMNLPREEREIMQQIVAMTAPTKEELLNKIKAMYSAAPTPAAPEPDAVKRAAKRNDRINSLKIVITSYQDDIIPGYKEERKNLVSRKNLATNPDLVSNLETKIKEYDDAIKKAEESLQTAKKELAALGTAPASDVQKRREEVRAAIMKAGQGEGGQFTVTLLDGTKENAVRLSLVGNELGVGNKGLAVDLSVIKKVENPDGTVIYDAELTTLGAASTSDVQKRREEDNKKPSRESVKYKLQNKIAGIDNPTPGNEIPTLSEAIKIAGSQLSTPIKINEGEITHVVFDQEESMFRFTYKGNQFAAFYIANARGKVRWEIAKLNDKTGTYQFITLDELKNINEKYGSQKNLLLTLGAKELIDDIENFEKVEYSKKDKSTPNGIIPLENTVSKEQIRLGKKYGQSYTLEDFLREYDAALGAAPVTPAPSRRRNMTADEVKNKTGEDPTGKVRSIGQLKNMKLSGQERIKMEDAAARLSKILPSWIKVEEMAPLLEQWRQGRVTFGSFYNNVIKLSRLAPSGTELHEAFHAVFRALLTDKQQDALYKEAKDMMIKELKKQGKSFIQGFESFKKERPDYTEKADMTEEQLKLLYIEEWMADEFAKRSKTKEAKQKVQKGEIQSLWDSFMDLLDRIFKFFTGQKNLTRLFADIEAGRFKAAEKPVINRFSKNPELNIEARSQIQVGYKQGGDGAIHAAFLDSSYQERFTNTIAGTVLDKLLSTDSKGKTASDFINEELDKLGELFDYANYPNIDFDNPDPSILDRIELIDDFNFIFNGTSAESQTAKDKFKAEILAKLKDLNVDEFDKSANEDYDGDDNITERSFDLNNENKGGFTSLSKVLRKYIATTTYTTTLDEFLGLEPGSLFGQKTITTTVDPKKVYNGIVKLTSNQADPRGVVRKMNYYRQTPNESSHFINRFFEDAGITFDENGEFTYDASKTPLIHRVVKAFNLYEVSYIFTGIDRGKIGVRKPDSKTYEANRKGMDMSQFEMWQGSYANLLLRKGKLEVQRLASTDINFAILTSNLVDRVTNQPRPLTVDEVNEFARVTKAKLAGLGISLSEEYLRYIVLADPNKIKTADQIRFVEEFKDSVKLSASEAKKNLEVVIGLMAQDKNPYEKGNIVDGEGAVGRLLKLAMDNAVFDETVSISTMQNAEGKNIYPYQKPSYHIQKVYELQNIDLTDPDVLQQIQSEKPNSDFLVGNRLLADETFRKILPNLKIERIDGMRLVEFDALGKSSSSTGLFEGVTYGKMSKRELALQMYVMFADSSTDVKVIETTREGKVIPMVKPVRRTLFNILEASNTADTLRLPVQNYIDQNGRITDSFKLAYLAEIKREFDRIQRVRNNEYTDKYNLFNAFTEREEDQRGRKFWETANFIDSVDKTGTLKSQLEKGEITFEQAAPLLLNGMDAYFLNELQQNLSELKKIGILNRDGSNRLLPQAYEGMAKDDAMFGTNLANNISNAYLNDFLNSISINQILMGDPALTLKNNVDWFKRARGNNASGDNMLGLNMDKNAKPIRTVTMARLNEKGELDDFYNEEYKVATRIYKIGSPEYAKYREGLTVEEREEFDRLKPKQIAVADAQAYTTVKGMGQFMDSLGRMTPRGFQIYKDIASGKKLDPQTELDNWDYLRKNGLMPNSQKLVYYDGTTYVKMSVTVLSPQYTTDPQGNPRPGMEFLHNMRIDLQNKNIDLIGPPSMMKKMIKNPYILDPSNPSFDIDESSVQNLDRAYLRLQQENPSNKTTIKDPTQQQNIVAAEQTSADIFFPWEPKVKSGKDLAQWYDKKLAERVATSFIPARNFLLKLKNNEWTIDMKRAVKAFKRTLEKTGASQQILDYLEVDENGYPIYNLNAPNIVKEFEQHFNAFFNNVLSQKVPGYKTTLQSGFMHRVLEDTQTGRIISTVEYDADPSKYSDRNRYKPRRLKFDQPRIINGKEVHRYSEVVIPFHFAEQFGLKPGDAIPEEIAYLFGTRIPSQDKHSAQALRIVDVLPPHYGSNMIAPDELILLTGSDFDIDSFYNQRPDHYIKKSKSLVIVPLVGSSEYKIIFGHPGIGKTFLRESGRTDVIDFDSDYKNRINEMFNLPKGFKARNEFQKNNKQEYEKAVRGLWAEAKQEALQTGKQLFASDMILLREFADDFDMVLTMSEKTFIERAKQRNDYTPGPDGTVKWKSNLDFLIDRIDRSKVFLTDKYLSDIQVSSTKEGVRFMVYGNNEDSKWEQFQRWNKVNNPFVKDLMDELEGDVGYDSIVKLALQRVKQIEETEDYVSELGMAGEGYDALTEVEKERLASKPEAIAEYKRAKEIVKKLRESNFVKALKLLGLPSTEEEFNKMGMRSMGEINNDILNARMVLHSNSSMTDINKTPATLEPIETSLDNLASDLGYSNWKEMNTSYSPNSMLGKLESFETNKAGQAAIGASVNNTNNYSIISRFGVPFQNREKSPIQEVIVNGQRVEGISPNVFVTQDGKRIMDVSSSLTSSMTDNPKYGYNSKLNIDINTLSVVSLLTMSRVRMYDAIRMINSQYVVRYITEGQDYAIQTEKEENDKKEFDSNLKKELIEKAVKASGGTRTITEILESGMGEVTSQDLALVTKYNPRSKENAKKTVDELDKYYEALDSEEYYNYLMAELRVFNAYITLSKNHGPEFIAFSQIVKLTKGIASSTKETSFKGDEDLKHYLETLNLKLVQTKDGWVVDYGDAKPEDKPFYDFKDILNRHLISLQNLNVFAEKSEAQKNYFISQTKFAEKLRNLISKGMKKRMKSKMRSKAMTQLRRDMESALMIMAWRNSLPENERENLNNYLFADIAEKNGMQSIDDFKKELLRVYPHLEQNIIFSQVFFKKEHSDLVSKVETNTRTKGNKGFEKQVMAAIRTLANNEGYPLVNYMIKHLIAKNGLQFKNESPVGLFSPSIYGNEFPFSQLMDSFTPLLNTLDEASFKQVFGMTPIEFMEEFQEKFMLDVNNRNYITKLPEGFTLKNPLLEKAKTSPVTKTDTGFTIDFDKGIQNLKNVALYDENGNIAEVLDTSNEDKAQRSINFKIMEAFQFTKRKKEDKIGEEEKSVVVFDFPKFIQIGKDKYKLKEYVPTETRYKKGPERFSTKPDEEGEYLGIAATYEKVPTLGYFGISTVGRTLQELRERTFDDMMDLIKKAKGIEPATTAQENAELEDDIVEGNIELSSNIPVGQIQVVPETETKPEPQQMSKQDQLVQKNLQTIAATSVTAGAADTNAKDILKFSFLSKGLDKIAAIYAKIIMATMSSNTKLPVIFVKLAKTGAFSMTDRVKANEIFKESVEKIVNEASPEEVIEATQKLC